MLTFLSVAFLIYGAMHVYALRKAWIAFPHSLALGLSLALWGLVMTFSPLILWYMTRQNWHSAAVSTSWIAFIWMGFLFLFCCIALVLDFGHALTALSGYTWPLNESIVFRTAGLLALALVGYGFVEARQIRVEQITITTPKLASGSVTIAQISDLHLGVMLGSEFVERVTAKLREINPGIIVATGDILDGPDFDMELAKGFSPLHPSMGGFAIIGNHEYYAGLENSARFLRNAGFTVLRNESTEAGGIIFTGVDDPSAFPGRKPQIVPGPGRKEAFTVLLRHQPIVDGSFPFDLQLSGHTHGGQIFPFGLITGFIYGAKPGLTEFPDGRRLYLSRGAGTWGPPIRLLAAPEITVITIESVNR